MDYSINIRWGLKAMFNNYVYLLKSRKIIELGFFYGTVYVINSVSPESAELNFTFHPNLCIMYGITL